MDMRTLIKAMLQPQPSERPSISEVLELSVVKRRIRKYLNEEDGYELMSEKEF
jgi:hypothetical protein